MTLPRTIASLCLLLTAVALGQNDPAAPSLTFHIATDLLQIPVLVLSRDGAPIPSIAPARFTLSINSGAPFHPLVRSEGDDPLSLAIVIDQSGAQSELLRQLPAATADLLQALRPADRLVIDTLDHCFLHHLLEPAPPSAVTLADALRRATEAPTPAASQLRIAHCGESNHLWETLAVVSHDLAALPGRRVLLVITNGHDTETDFSWRHTRDYAVLNAVTIFSLTDPRDGWRQTVIRKSYGHGRSEDDILANIDALTGGTTLFSDPAHLAPALAHFIDLLRGRYIIEFPRPEHLRTSLNTIDVQVQNLQGTVRSSGISFPRAEDPNPTTAETIRAQPRPTAGNRVNLPDH